MLFSVKKLRAVLTLGLGLVLAGCTPAGPGAADEEKEPQFLIGRSRVNSMDFSGAIEAFEQALEMNPRSAAAHFELGWLYAEKEAEPAAAIYHYQKFLKLRPGTENAETIRQHVFRLKQELAKAALPIPPSTEMQRQLEQITEEKRRLQEEVDRLRQALTQVPRTNRPSGTVGVVRPGTLQNAGGAGSSSPVRPTVARRSHRVQPGETLASIARRYNVSLESLLASNPTLNPRRLQVGQSLVIPAR